MDNKIIKEINRIHDILYKSRLLNEIIGQVTTPVVRATIKNIIKSVIKKTIRGNLEQILKKSPKYLDDFMKLDDLFKNSQDEIIKALKKSDPNIAKMNPDMLKMSVRSHFNTLAKEESAAITKELVDDLGKVAVKSVPPIKIPKPGDLISNSSFVDDVIDWSKVKNAKNMKEYNQVIIDALKTNDFSKISKGGFEKYGITNFREFLEKGINKEKKLMFDPNKGTWFFELNKNLPKQMTSAVAKVVEKATPESVNLVKNVAEELGNPTNIKKLKSGLLGKEKFFMKRAELINNLKSWGVLDDVGKITKVGWASLTVLGLGTTAMYGALQESGVDMSQVPANLETPDLVEAGWENYPCVTKAAGIKKETLNDGTIGYVGGGYRWYGNGRRQNLATGEMSSYHCSTDNKILEGPKPTSGGSGESFAQDGIGRTTRSVSNQIPTLLQQAGIEGTSLTQDTINKLYDKLSNKA